MKLLVLGIVGLLLVAGVFVAASLQEDSPEEEGISVGTCSGSCGNYCNAESNCGISTCGAVSGGTCGCS